LQIVIEVVKQGSFGICLEPEMLTYVEYAALSASASSFKIALVKQLLARYIRKNKAVKQGSFGICLESEMLIYARFSFYSIVNLKSLRELRKLVSFP
jgi:hypothetical protein